MHEPIAWQKLMICPKLAILFSERRAAALFTSQSLTFVISTGLSEVVQGEFVTSANTLVIKLS